jgi:CO dehydrogenase maturation factor
MNNQGFRVVITGKGGVGKTTITAILSHLFVQRFFSILAVDEDPQMNLPFALGVRAEDAASIIPLSSNLDYIEEKTGARPDSGYGMMISLNPDVSDVVDRFGMRGPDGVNILVMGTVLKAASGCLCPENTLLDAVIRHINLREGEVILMDTQAGVEHFGRALAKGFNQAVLVTDPTFNGVQVVKHAARLARDLQIQYIHLVVNRVRYPSDIEKVDKMLENMEEVFSAKFYVPYDEQMQLYEPDVRPLLSEPSEFVDGIRELQMSIQMHGLMHPYNSPHNFELLQPDSEQTQRK